MRTVNSFIGSPIERLEDLRFLRGRGEYVDDLTPLQKSFRKHHALQCGFCTPGMITTAHMLLTEEPDCDANRVREVLSGNICRCTGYISIVEAVLDARAAYRKVDAKA